MIFRMLQALENKIKTLEDLKADGYQNLPDLLSNEKSVDSTINILDEFLRRAKNIETFIFPYFDKFLELSYSPIVLKSLLLIGLTILSNENYHRKALIQLSSLFVFLGPFVRLLQYFNWEYSTMIKTFTQIFEEKTPTEQVTKTLKELFPAILDNGSVILKLLEEDSSLLKLSNKTRFVSALGQKVHAECGITKEKDFHKYYKSLGEVMLASFLLEPELNERILPDIAIIHCFEGIKYPFLGLLHF